MTEPLIQIETKPKRDPRALNAYRHGLTGQVHIGTQAEQDAYDDHCKTIHDSLVPMGGLENKLTQVLAGHLWRLARAMAIEDSIFSFGIHQNTHSPEGQHPELFGGIGMAFKWAQDDKALDRLGLYLTRIQRDVEKSRKMLEAEQDKRRAALQQAAEESNLLAQLAESKGESYHPERDFPIAVLSPQFVFSSSDLAVRATHLRCLDRAKTLLETRKKFLQKAA